MKFSASYYRPLSSDLKYYYFIGISRIFLAFAKVYSREIILLMSLAKYRLKYKKMVKIGMKIRKFSQSFPRSRKFILTKLIWPLAIAKVYPREISIKIQKNGQNWHENQKIQSKFPSIAKVYTHEVNLALGDRESLSPRKFIPIKYETWPF